MNDCIVLEEGKEPYIVKVSKNATYYRVQDDRNGGYIELKFHIFRGNSRDEINGIYYAVASESEPDYTVVFSSIQELGSIPLGNDGFQL